MTGSGPAVAAEPRLARPVAVMAAIVTTLMGAPVWGLLASVSFGVLDISFHAFLTFGGALNAFQGVLAWWALGYLPALVYSRAMCANR